MCGDLTDPNNPDRQNAPTFFGPSFNFSPTAAQSSPSTTSTVVDKLIINAPGKPPVHIETEPLTITEWNQQLQTLDNPVLIQNLPQYDNFQLPTKPTPCVTRSPAGVSMTDLNNTMYPLALTLMTKFIQDGKEHAAVVYKMPDGSLHQSFTISGSESAITNTRIDVPPDAIVVGYAHTHPFGGGSTPSPSGQHGTHNDEDFINALASPNGGVGKGDPDLISYIITPDTPNNSSFSFLVYDRNHLHNPIEGCQLESLYS